jgi:hypothetical protein
VVLLSVLSIVSTALAGQLPNSASGEGEHWIELDRWNRWDPSPTTFQSIRVRVGVPPPSIPYVATRNDAVRDMLWMANVGKDDVVYDLGSGDGRIVIAAVRDFGARRAVGVEIDPERVRESRDNAEKASVTDRVQFIEGDLFTNVLREATVVTLFLGHRPNIILRPRLFRLLQPGTRVVSHQFGMGEWQTDKSMTTRTAYLGMWGESPGPFHSNRRVPDYAGNESHFGRSDTILMWIVPAPVAGVWRGKIETGAGPQDLTVVLHQRLSDVTGTYRISPHANLTGKVFADLWGDHLRFAAVPDASRFQLRFDGHVHDDTLRGKFVFLDGEELRESEWEARRDQADFTGTWEWPCLSGPRMVALQIERHDGQYAVTYLDRDQPVTVTDFYDHGGGLYFTLLIGDGGDSGIELTEENGWLLGEGVLEDGLLNGTIEFHPVIDFSGARDRSKASRPLPQAWTPERNQAPWLPR